MIRTIVCKILFHGIPKTKRINNKKTIFLYIRNEPNIKFDKFHHKSWISVLNIVPIYAHDLDKLFERQSNNTNIAITKLKVHGQNKTENIKKKTMNLAQEENLISVIGKIIDAYS